LSSTTAAATPDEAKSVVDQIRAAGGRGRAPSAAPDGAHKLAAQVRDLVGERLDIIVANAGISKAAAIETHQSRTSTMLFAVNVRRRTSWCSNCCRSRRRLKHLLLSSLGAHVAVGALSAYAATKGAVDTCVKYFALASAARHPRQCVAVAPGRDRHRTCRTSPRPEEGRHRREGDAGR